MISHTPSRVAPVPEVPLPNEGPHVDYQRQLTDTGSILLTYKDLDLRLRHTLMRVLLWSCFTGFAGWYVLHVLLANSWRGYLAVGVAALVNFLIVSFPVEVYRTIEIRRDCMILDGKDIFWLGLMENGWPSLKPDPEGHQILCGIYGTRFVEYATVRRFDDNDRTPEVLQAHLLDAMRQLWGAFR